MFGVTNSLHARVEQHRRGVGSDFCRQYNLHCLVLAERPDHIAQAIAREKALKAWKREWKIRLIEEMNPEWRDLFDFIAYPPEMPAFAGMTVVRHGMTADQGTSAHPTSPLTTARLTPAVIAFQTRAYV